MIIGIDGNEANVKNRVGIGQYSFELLTHLERLRENNLEFKIYLKENYLSYMPSQSERWKYRIIKPGALWTQWRLPIDLYLHRPQPNVFFSPSHYAPRFSPVPSVISVMDLSYLYFPELFRKQDLQQLRMWTEYSVKKAKKILTISQSSKNDIIKEYKVEPENVVVTYPGIKSYLSLNPNIYAMNKLKSKYDIKDNFLLFVGTLQPRKNISRLIEAFSKIKNAENMDLVIVGKKGWLYDEILNAPKKFDVEKNVHFLESVTDEELQVLYKNAACFVLPSLYEGFGLPVLEAMQAGCPVITSDVSSLPEAGGDACLYVNPEDVSDITEKINKLVGNEKLRQDMIVKGKKQAEKFNWEKTAKQTLQVLESVAKGE